MNISLPLREGGFGWDDQMLAGVSAELIEAAERMTAQHRE